MTIRPMLAAQKYRAPGDLFGKLHENVVQNHLNEDGYLIMQPKIDGMRCILHNGQALSRRFKPLGNSALQTFARETVQFSGFDGEVFSGHDYSGESFRKSMSGVRASGGERNLTIVVFDHIGFAYLPFIQRYLEAKVVLGADEQIVRGPDYAVKLIMCPKREVRSLDEIYAYEAELLEAGWEGGILRRPYKLYKYGRSTALGGELVKVKRRDYVDARVVGYEQRFENQNEARTNELGLTSRSSHKEGKVPLDMLGALHLELLNGSGIQTKCGVFRGLSHEDLRDLWNKRDTLTGRYCEVSIDKASGGYDSCRTPVWVRWRDASEF